MAKRHEPMRQPQGELDMKTLVPSYLERLVIPPRLMPMLRRIGEHKGRQELYRQQSPEMLENLRQVGIVQSTESSNRLEGISVSPKRLQELIEQKTIPRNRSEAEIAGYRDVLNTIHQNSNRIPLSSNIVLQLHRDLMKYSGKEGGRWKSAPNTITEKQPDGTILVRFEPVVPHLTAEAMRTLHDQYEMLLRQDDWDPLLLIPFYVLDFLCIHPFLDGNGRMARLLTVLALYHQGYEVGRYISLERVIEQSKESYYDTLYVSSQGWHEGQHNVWPWAEYFLSVMLASYEEFERRVGMVSSGPGSKTGMVLSTISGFLGDFSISNIEKACPTVSRDMIRHVLFKERDAGRIVSIGKGRGAKWRKSGE